ncbi:MAG: hypothetical protein ACJ78Q_19540 [Chloroflexia bacterium]
MQRNWPAVILAVVVGLAAGVLPGFFLVFNAVFSDSGTISEHFVVLVVVFLVYAVLGAVLGAIWPQLPYWLALALAAPAVVLVVWYTVNDSGFGAGRLLLHAIYLLVTIGGSYLGWYAGARIRGVPA